MPRNASGVYTLPAGNPVVPGTTIDAAWANDTLEDLANEVTNSLSRTGAGGMLAPFRIADGTVTAPGLAFLNETGSGLYRSGAGSVWMSILGVNTAQFATTGVNIPVGKTLNVAGTLAVTGSSNLSDVNAVHVDFDTAGSPAAVARLRWNDTDGTLDLGLKGGNVTLQVGQEEVVRARNNTGSTITDPQVVYSTGSSGTHPTIALAQANSEATSTKVLGVVTESIANGADGFVTTSGMVRDVNTSAFAEGVVLWLSATTPGGLTSTRPTAPNHGVMVGYCVRAHATQGVIYVMVQNGYELDELHDVLITSVANNNLLKYNSSASVWQNVAGPAGAVVGTTDTQTLTNKTISGGTVTGAVVTGLANPTTATDAATKAYVDSVAEGLDAKASCQLATTANITLSGVQTVDGVTADTNDRVLVKNQTNATENGIYVVNLFGAWARSSDANTWNELVAAYTFVEKGATNANNGYVCTVQQGGTLGATPVTWAQFSGAGQINAGTGMSKTGNTLNVNTASSSHIVVGADEIDLATTGVLAGTYTQLTVDQWGRATGGANPTTLAGYGITDAYTKTYIDTLYGSTASAAASAADALTYKNAAASSASAAASSASNAASSASSASSSASSASGSASSAASAASSALSYLNTFRGQYIGASATDPTVDGNGNPLTAGDLYYNTTANEMRVYSGSTWIAAYLPSSGYVTLTGAETLTNKTISTDNNTINGLAASSFVLSNASGNIDGSAAQKAIPSGVVVGTSDTQTLTNKTIAFGSNTLTDVASTNTAQTFTGTKTFSGTTSTLGIVLNDAAEVATVSATAATGTINYDITTQAVLYYTSNASANWTVNFRASSGTTLNTALATGQSVTVAFLVTQGATAYYNSAVQVDGTTTGVTTRWIGGAPTAGNASGIDSYRYLIIKTGASTFTVLASVNQFKA